MDCSDEEYYDEGGEMSEEEDKEEEEDITLRGLSLTPSPFKAALLANIDAQRSTGSKNNSSNSSSSSRPKLGQKVFCRRPVLLVEEVKSNIGTCPRGCKCAIARAWICKYAEPLPYAAIRNTAPYMKHTT